MIKISALAADTTSPVGGAVLEFAALTGVPAEVAGGGPSTATLILRPPRVKSATIEALIAECCAAERPYFTTEGLKTREVLAWLDSLEAQQREVVLQVAGPAAAETTWGAERATALLERILVAA